MDLTKKLNYETLSRKDFKPKRSSRLHEVIVKTDIVRGEVTVHVEAKTPIYNLELYFRYKNNSLLYVESLSDLGSDLGRTYLKKWITGTGKRYVDIWVYNRICNLYYDIRKKMVSKLEKEFNAKQAREKAKALKKLKEEAEYKRFLELKEKYDKPRKKVK